MIWKDHSKEMPDGFHAFMGGSNYQWLNYTPDKLVETYKNMWAKEEGTKLHALAEELIRRRIKLPGTKKTFNMYVNDAIGYRMTPEVKLYFSPFCAGTADTLHYDEKKRFLRIHDLKTGSTPAKLHQLEIYSALFCLDYGIVPGELSGIELRIYQNNDILIGNPEADDIAPIMDKIITNCKILDKVMEEKDSWLIM